MGLEVGWYLRFPRGDRIEALVDASTVAQLEHQLYTVSGWEMTVEELGEHARAVFTKKPRKTD